MTEQHAEGIPMNPAAAEPGYQTTEFWGTTVASIVALIPGLTGHISMAETAAVIGGIQAAYAVARSFRKKGTTA